LLDPAFLGSASPRGISTVPDPARPRPRGVGVFSHSGGRTIIPLRAALTILALVPGLLAAPAAAGRSQPARRLALFAAVRAPQVLHAHNRGSTQSGRGSRTLLAMAAPGEGKMRLIDTCVNLGDTMFQGARAPPTPLGFTPSRCFLLELSRTETSMLHAAPGRPPPPSTHHIARYTSLLSLQVLEGLQPLAE